MSAASGPGGLPVFYEGRLVGTVRSVAEERPDSWARAVLPQGRRRRSVHPRPVGVTFAYDEAWLSTKGAFPISTRFPLGAPIEPGEFQVWASNLLPESGHLRTLARSLQVDPEDVVGMLARVGRDTAGALSIGAPGSTQPGRHVKVMSEDDLERIIRQLPSKPFLVGEAGVSMSLAGAQSKLGVGVDADGRICLPVDGAPSTHILKPDSERMWGSVQNEAFCLVLAAMCGIPTPGVTTGRAGERTYFLIERYDRFQRDGRVRRRHQEDFAQALGIPPGSKYESNETGNKGPGAADMFGIARGLMPGSEVARLLDQVVFNVLACNTDAHAKNYSLVIGPSGPRMSPLYDVMCASAWPEITKNLAQKIGGKSRGDYLERRHWYRFAQSIGQSPDAVVDRVQALGRAVLDNAEGAQARVDAMPAGPHPMMGQFRDAIELRARNLLRGLDARQGIGPVEDPDAPEGPSATP